MVNKFPQNKFKYLLPEVKHFIFMFCMSKSNDVAIYLVWYHWCSNSLVEEAGRIEEAV